MGGEGPDASTRYCEKDEHCTLQRSAAKRLKVSMAENWLRVLSPCRESFTPHELTVSCRGLYDCGIVDTILERCRVQSGEAQRT